MQFNFNVKPTKVLSAGIIAFAFIPETIEITTGEKSTLEDGSEVVSITTKLRQVIDGGYIDQVREQKLPISILQAVNGFDPISERPTVNMAALNQILSSFNLEAV